LRTVGVGPHTSGVLAGLRPAYQYAMTQTILFVGGANLAGSVRQRLEQNGFAVSAVTESAPAIQVLTDSFIDLVIVQLDERDHGTDLIRQVREVLGTKATAVLAIAEWGTGLPTVALAAGADAYEPAPIDPERLMDAVQRVLHKRAAVVGMND
jgi:CheY-like chemotaxis protein